MRKRNIGDYFVPASNIVQTKIKEQTKQKKAKVSEAASLANDEDLGSETSKESDEDEPPAVGTNEVQIQTKKFGDLNVDSRLKKSFPIPFHDFLQYTNVLEITDAEIKKSRKNSHETFIHDMKYVQKIARRCYDHFYTKPNNRKFEPLKFIKLSEESPAYVKEHFMDIPEEFQKQKKNHVRCQRKELRKHVEATVSSAIEMKDDGLEPNSCLMSNPAETADSHLLKETDISDLNFPPPSFNVFRKFVNFEEEFAKRKLACTGDVNVDEENEKSLYKEFYSSPTLRHKLSWKLRPCPRSIKDQILTRMPLVDDIIPNDCYNSLASNNLESHSSTVNVVEHPESNKSSEIDSPSAQLETPKQNENHNSEQFTCDKDSESNVSRLASNLDEPIEPPKSIDSGSDKEHVLISNKIFTESKETDGLQVDVNGKTSNIGNKEMLTSSNKRSATKVSAHISPPAKKPKTVLVDINNKIKRIKDKIIEDYVGKKTKNLDEDKRKLILEKIKQMDQKILIVVPTTQNQICLIEQKSSKSISEMQENSGNNTQENGFCSKEAFEEINSITQRKSYTESTKDLKEPIKQTKNLSPNKGKENNMSKGNEMLSHSALEIDHTFEDKAFFCKVPKNHTLAYVVRLSRGLKQDILRAILNMTLQDFYKYTRIQGKPNIYENSEVLKKIYEFAILNEQTWPISLYMTLHDMLEYLATKKILFKDFSLIHISPKIVHYEELIIITDFDEIVRFDFFRETNKKLDDLCLYQRRRHFYNRCWAHDKWIWRVPTLVDYWALAIMENYSENSIKSTLSICIGSNKQLINKNETQVNLPTPNNSSAGVALPTSSQPSICTSLLDEEKENAEIQKQNINTQVPISSNESTPRVESPNLSETPFSNTILDKNNKNQKSTHIQNPLHNQVLNNSVDESRPTLTSKNKTPLPLSPNVFLTSSGSTASEHPSQQNQTVGAQKENDININITSVCIPSDNYLFISVQNTQEQIESLPMEETLSLDPLKDDTMLENQVEKVPYKEQEFISQSFNASSNSEPLFSIANAVENSESNKSLVIGSKDANLETPKENENYDVEQLACDKDTQINDLEIGTHSDEPIESMQHDATSNKIFTGSEETNDLQADMNCKTNDVRIKEETTVKCLNQLQFCIDDSNSSEIHVHALEPTPPIDIDDDDICKINTKTVSQFLDILIKPTDETVVSNLTFSGSSSTQLNENSLTTVYCNAQRIPSSLEESDAVHHTPPPKTSEAFRNTSENSINSSEDVELLLEINVDNISDSENLDISFEDSQNFSDPVDELNLNRNPNGDQTMTDMEQREKDLVPETLNQEKSKHPSSTKLN